MSERIERCDRCRFWKHIEGHGELAEGECRHNSPVSPASPKKLVNRWVYPLYAADWCGQFQPLPVQQMPPVTGPFTCCQCRKSVPAVHEITVGYVVCGECKARIDAATPKGSSL